MDKIIKKLNALRSDKLKVEQSPVYCYGFADAINIAIKIIKESDYLPIVSKCTCINDVGDFEAEDGKIYCSACEKEV